MNLLLHTVTQLYFTCRTCALYINIHQISSSREMLSSGRCQHFSTLIINNFVFLHMNCVISWQHYATDLIIQIQSYFLKPNLLLLLLQSLFIQNLNNITSFKDFGLRRFHACRSNFDRPW